MTRRSSDLFKKKDTQDSRHQHQHQIVLISHVLNLKIQENLQNSIFELKIIDLQCKIIVLNFIQLHLVSLSFSFSITLIFMKLNFEEFDLNVDNSKSQLNQETLDSKDDLIDVFTQTL